MIHRKTAAAPNRQPGAAALFALVFAAVLFLNGLHFKSRKQESTASMTIYDGSADLALSDDDLNLHDGNEVKIEIVGYWKEVRASLGLAPLADTIISRAPANPNPSLTPSEGHEVKKGVVRFTGRRHRQRLGRLNPALLRRRELLPDGDIYRSESVTVDGLRRLDVDVHTVVEDTDALLDDSSSNLRKDLARASSSSPAPFLAADSEATPRLSARTHAAAFRAIAAHELRMKAPRDHPGRRQHR